MLHTLTYRCADTYIPMQGQTENERLVHQQWPEDEEMRFEVQEIQIEFWRLI